MYIRLIVVLCIICNTMYPLALSLSHLCPQLEVSEHTLVANVPVEAGQWVACSEG